jgi:hypothetical protein
MTTVPQHATHDRSVDHGRVLLVCILIALRQ